MVDEKTQPVYDMLIEAVAEYAGDSDFIFAGPDSPEVYFLSGRRNPSWVIFSEILELDDER